MQTMLTVTANDNSPELAAAVRRGPFAVPTETELVEYLLSRKRIGRPSSEQHGVFHVIAYQRRLAYIKNEFFSRNFATPLGELEDWWDRTEAQQRGALHSHILMWYGKRDLKIYKNYAALPPIPRTVAGSNSKQRAHKDVLKELEEYQEDNIYFHNKVARIWGECTRPYVKHSPDTRWGGYDYVLLRFAGLCRSIQSRNYLHICSLRYCLQGRSTCRFFFPWPKTPQQQHCDNTDRTALQRRLQSDDQWV